MEHKVHGEIRMRPIRKDILFVTFLIINFIIGGFLYVNKATDGQVIVSQLITLIIPMIILIVAKKSSTRFNNWLES